MRGLVLSLILALPVGAGACAKHLPKNLRACAAAESQTTAAGSVRVHYFGASTLLLEGGREALLIDGFASRPGVGKVLGGQRMASNPERVRQLRERIEGANVPVRAVFVSHSHYDHALDAGPMANALGATVYGSASSLRVVDASTKDDVRPTTQLLRDGESHRIGDFDVTAFRTAHATASEQCRKKFRHSEEIAGDFCLPAKRCEFRSGPVFDFHVRHRDVDIWIKSSVNHDLGLGQHPESVELLLLAVGRPGADISEDPEGRYFRPLLRGLDPAIVAPIHWDNLTKTANNDALPPIPRIGDRKLRKRMRALASLAAEESRKFVVLDYGQTLTVRARPTTPAEKPASPSAPRR